MQQRSIDERDQRICGSAQRGEAEKIFFKKTVLRKEHYAPTVKNDLKRPRGTHQPDFERLRTRGKRYKNFLAVIRTWARKEQKPLPRNEAQVQPVYDLEGVFT